MKMRTGHLLRRFTAGKQKLKRYRKRRKRRKRREGRRPG
jgi:hypothetical protein